MINTSGFSQPYETIDDLKDMGPAMINIFGEYKQAILRDLFRNLMETTPERTGTLRYNWRFHPYDHAGDFLAENDGTKKPWPREPDDVFYERNWRVMTIYNNSPYINIVNSGEGGNAQNQNFIEQALEMTDYLR